MIFQDLRQFIENVKETNDIKEVSGADWGLEIGAITDISSEIAEPPLLLQITIILTIISAIFALLTVPKARILLAETSR